MVLRVYEQLTFLFNLEILVSVTGCLSVGMCSLIEIYQYIFTLKVQDVDKYQNKRHHIPEGGNVYRFLLFKTVIIICSRKRILSHKSLCLTTLQGNADDTKTPNS